MSGTRMKVAAALFPFEPFVSSPRPAQPMMEAQLKLVEEFNRDIMANRISFEEVPCLCGSPDFELIASVDRYAMLQKTVLCTNCGLIRSNPRMTHDQYREFYSSDLYRRCYEGDDYIAVDSRKYSDNSVAHIFEAVEKIRKVTPSTTVLEVGAGGGWNLLPFMRAGASVRGVEYSPSLVELGRRHGIDMVQGGADAASGLYDVVILNHLLEHLPDPIGTLKSIAGHMRDESVMYIGVPNITNFSIFQLQNAHTYYFTPWTFEYFCSRSGLRLVSKGPAQRIHMFGIFKKGPPVETRGLEKHYAKIRSRLIRIGVKYRVKFALNRLGLYPYP